MFLVLLEQKRGILRLRLAEILVQGFGTGGCPHRCGWTSKYAYAYMILLEETRLVPTELPSISNSITEASNMRDPVPEEASVNCNYEAKHAEPKYRESRGWRLGALTSLGFACIVFDQAALNPIAPLPIRNVRGIW